VSRTPDELKAAGKSAGWKLALAAALKSRTTATISHDGDEPLAQHGVAFRQIVRSQHSIRINDQWRLCFRWKGEDVHEVEIVDYH
jgi:plasmid maintenance system killer protein